MKISIASDHDGFTYKEEIKRFLNDAGHEVHDFGTGLVTVPIILSFVLNQQWIQAATMAIVAVGVALMDNFLRPWLARGGLQLHPVWILLSMLGGVSVFGPLGLVIGPMVVVLIRTLLSLLFRSETSGPRASAVTPSTPAGEK